MYHLLSRRPAPLVKRSMVFGIAERMGPDGTVRAPLDEASVERAVRQALDAGAEGIVVSLLHAYRNPAHELRVREIAEALAPGLPVSCSSETWPIIREYERTITAVIGGYVQPRVAHYLTSLQQALKNAGVQPEPRLTKSNGGVMTAEQGKRDCVQMILSGTAAGVIGASHVAATAGLPRCLSLDIGGTSADIAVIVDGKPQYGVGELIGDFQIYIPSVSVSSVGEGGGSIAWVDPLGVLKVGPESAGSHPGPACYRRGGTRATITDAFVCCGLVGHSELGYQAVTVDADASRQAVGELADRLGRGIEETAEAIIQIAVSGMYSEVSGLVSRYGIDPREYAVLAFGGAGPMLGCFLARELKVREIVVPPSPGTLSALGGLIADLKSDFLKTVYTDLSADRLAFVCDEFATLAGRARQWLAQEQDTPRRPSWCTRPKCAIAASRTRSIPCWTRSTSRPATCRRWARPSTTCTGACTGTPTNRLRFRSSACAWSSPATTTSPPSRAMRCAPARRAPNARYASGWTAPGTRCRCTRAPPWRRASSSPARPS